MTTKTTNSVMQYLPSSELPRMLEQDIASARQRVDLMAMNFSTDAKTTPVLQAAVTAAERSATVTVLPDSYAWLFPDNIWRFSLTGDKRKIAAKAAARLRVMLLKLRAAGASTRFVYRPTGLLRRVIPIARRNHSKLYLADDVAYCFGGSNFSAESFAHHDYMFRVTEPAVVDWLHSIAAKIAKQGRLRGPDIRKQFAALGTVLFDVGKPRRSLIYEEAIKLVASADARLIYVSQHRPGGRMKRVLIEAQARLDQELVVFNHYSKFRFFGRIQQRLESISGVLREKNPRRGYVHAKFIIAYYKDGSRKALSGSHNFHAGGVWLGTAEVALLTENSEVIDALESFTEQLPL